MLIHSDLWKQFISHYPTEAQDYMSGIIEGTQMRPLCVEVERGCGYSSFCQAMGLFTSVELGEYSVTSMWTKYLKDVRAAYLEENVGRVEEIVNSKWLIITEQMKEPVIILNRINWVLPFKIEYGLEVKFNRLQNPVPKIVEQLKHLH